MTANQFKSIIVAAAFCLFAPVLAQATETETSNSAKPATAQMEQQIHINTASADELQLLKGIGKTKANAIVEYRTSHGQFHDINELQQVKGIGEKLIANNADKLAL